MYEFNDYELELLIRSPITPRDFEISFQNKKAARLAIYNLIDKGFVIVDDLCRLCINPKTMSK